VRVLAGTSGFSYPAWRGSFYPEDLPPARMLAFYAERLEAVEVNATFYRMPRPSVLSAWRAAAGPRFSFALKAPRRITHLLRLRAAEGHLAAFYRAAAELGPCLGPVLFQLPPDLGKDLPRLKDFLGLLPAGGQAAFEFRHPSWFADEVLAALAERGAALVHTDAEEGATPLVPTAGFGYLRLRRERYSGEELRTFARRILGAPWATAHVFFKHEDSGRGPAEALALRRLVEEAAPAELTP